ncbi:MAG: DUF2156 domain-containing protein [Fimbriimonadaceae bacterium]|nr:DUF2156 domain-containing protein [Fimbriimonadaceae bacterium]
MNLTHPSTETLLAREIILSHGTNVASYQLVNDGITKWFNRDQTSVIGYVDHFGIRVVAGNPVCPRGKLPEVLKEFFSDCKLANKRPCFFAGIPPLLETSEEICASSRIAIGTQPCWNLAEWKQTITTHASLKEQLRRSRAKGVTIREYSTEEAENNPGLQSVLDSWLADRGLPPLHFLVEPQTLNYLVDRRTFVAEQNGEPIAFLNLCPIATRKGWLTEQFPRSPSAPNGTVELMLHTAALQLAEEEFEFLTMGLIPFSSTVMSSDLPKWLKALATWARAHGRRFYNFNGLENFKSKFHPHTWETVYAVVPEPKIKLIHIAAIAQAFADEPLPQSITKSLLRAVRQEYRWLARKDR